MDGVAGLSGWRWIFILEGILTVAVAIVAPFAIHDSPETAKFLTEQERAWVIHALRIQNSADSREMVLNQDKFKMKFVFDAFKDWQIWLGLFSECLSQIANKVDLCYRLADMLITQCTGVSPARSTVSRSSFLLSSRTLDTNLPRRSS